MATPVISTSTRFYPRGTSKCYYIPSIAAANLTPTRAEMDAGTNITPQLADWSGFSVSGNDIETPDLDSEFDKTIPGSTSAEESSLTLYADLAGVDVRTLLPRGTAGYVMWMPGGDVAGYKASVWPIRVKSNSETMAMDEADKRNVTVSITDEPAENVTIPA